MRIDLAIAQFRPTKADPAASLESLRELLSRAAAADPRPSLVVLPETALTGYFLEGGVREQAVPAERLLERLDEACGDAWAAGPGDGTLDVAIGFYELHERRVYNSALYARLGGPEPRLLHVHRKVFLPTYGVFQEERFVEAGAGVRAFDAGWGRVALLICEEAFHSISGTLAALDGADVILVLSASPARGAAPGAGLPGNIARWDLLGSGLASEHGVFVAVSQLVGFEGGKGFAGGSAAYSPRGERIARGPLWEPALVPVSFDLDEIVAARTDEPLLADLERAWTRLLVHSPGAGVERPGARLASSDEGAGGEP